MSTNELLKVKGQTPISVIIHGGGFLGYSLAKTLLEQGSQVVIVDKYTADSKSYFSQLKNLGKVSFIEFKGLKNFLDKINHIDYLYYILEEHSDFKSNLESKEFLQESDYLNSCLITSHKYKAKIALITSLYLNRELANRVNNGNLSQPSPYSSLELQRYCENLTAEFGDKTKANVRIIRLGTLLGKGVKKISNDVLDKLFSDATNKSQIEIVGEGLEIQNILSEEDAVFGIIKLMFQDNTRGEVISLCNKNDYSTLSLAYKLLELDVESKTIKFVENDNILSILQDMYVPAPNASQYGWKQTSSLEETIVNQLQSYYENSKKKWSIGEEDISKRRKKEEKITIVSDTKLGEIFNKLTKPFRKAFDKEKIFTEISYTKILKYTSILIMSFLSIYYLIAPLVGITLGGALIYKDSKEIYSSLSEFDFENINSKSISIGKNIDRIKNSISRTYWIFKLTGSTKTYENINQLIVGTEYAVDSAYDLSIGLEPLGKYASDFEPAVTFGTQQGNTAREYREYLQSINSKRYNITEGTYKISLAQNLISSVDTKTFPTFAQDWILQYKDAINTAGEVIKPFDTLTQFIPDVLGVNERKRYLILLQNDGELRSTGGWISSYAIVGIEGGQIRELYVDDIYNADGTLKVQGKSYKASTSMIKALGDTKYTFSLVNWDPNLSNVLTESEQFIYDLGKGNDLDGVITIDTMFVQKLLQKWNGIEVPGESELITSDNLYSKIFEMHTEYTPGSSRKSTFLANLANETVTKLLSSDFAGYKDIAEVIVESLNEKHIQGAFKNTIAQSYFDQNNWDGNIDEEYQTSPTGIDWNWGANKANLYLKKNYTLGINIKNENTIDYSYQVAIQNESTEDKYPQGTYTNYIRVYIPANAQITSINGIIDNKYDIYTENGMKVVGGWFNVPIKETKTLDISYRISKTSDSYFPVKIDNNRYIFDLNIYKQPGSRKDAYNLSIKYPSAWYLENSSELSSIGSELNRRFDLDTDKQFEIEWSK